MSTSLIGSLPTLFSGVIPPQVLNTQSKEINQMRQWLVEQGVDEGVRCSAGSGSMGGMDGTGGIAGGMVGMDMDGMDGSGMDGMGRQLHVGGPHLVASDDSCGITDRLSNEGVGSGGRILHDEVPVTGMGGMAMGCGNTSCLSSKCFEHENL